MQRHLDLAAIVAAALALLASTPLCAKEPPLHYRAARSTVVELDLATGATRTVSEHRDNSLTLLDQRDGLLLGVEYGGPDAARMIGLSAASGKVLWELPTDNETWSHYFEHQYLSERRHTGFSLPSRDFAKPPPGGRGPFCGFWGDQLAGIDPPTGRVLWQIEPPRHPENRFAWRAVFNLRDHVAAAVRGRVRIVRRSDGEVLVDLPPERPSSYYRAGRPVETDQHVLLAFDPGGNRKQLIRWNKKSGEVEQRVDPATGLSSVLAATEDLLLTNESGKVCGRDIQNLKQVVWRQKTDAWFDPGSPAVVWGGHLVTRSPDMPTIDLRDGSGFSLFQQPKGREIHYANYPWAAQGETLYTVSSSGILGWPKTQLQSQGGRQLGNLVWKPAAATGYKRAPDFVDCLMGDGKAYLVLVHAWEPLYD